MKKKIRFTLSLANSRAHRDALLPDDNGKGGFLQGRFIFLPGTDVFQFDRSSSFGHCDKGPHFLPAGTIQVNL